MRCLTGASAKCSNNDAKSVPSLAQNGRLLLAAHRDGNAVFAQYLPLRGEPSTSTEKLRFGFATN
jgi:hypothetical protein